MTVKNDGKLTVGVPVYNGDSLIAEALGSLMDDQCKQLDICVYDNASEDQTARIVKNIIAEDGQQKISYHRHDQNIGAVANFLYAVENCHSEYFAWRAYDDLSDADYFSVLKKKLDENPEAILAAPKIITTRMGTSKKRARPFRATSDNQFDLLKNSQAGWMYGLFRTRFLKQTIRSVHDQYPFLWAWDHLILFHAVLHGGIVGSNEAVFHQRLNNFAEKASGGHSRKDRRAIVSAYYNYCSARIDETDFSAARRHLLRLAVMRHINRRVMRLRKLLF